MPLEVHLIRYLYRSNRTTTSHHKLQEVRGSELGNISSWSSSKKATQQRKARTPRLDSTQFPIVWFEGTERLPHSRRDTLRQQASLHPSLHLCLFYSLPPCCHLRIEDPNFSGRAIARQLQPRNRARRIQCLCNATLLCLDQVPSLLRQTSNSARRIHRCTAQTNGS